MNEVPKMLLVRMYKPEAPQAHNNNVGHICYRLKFSIFLISS